jgi:hypothetical protein
MAAQSQSLVQQQQTVILEQHAKLQLQEQVLEELRRRLNAAADMAFPAAGRALAAALAAETDLRAALQRARTLDDFQAALAALPKEAMQTICECVFDEVGELWPEVGASIATIRGGVAAVCNQVLEPVRA